MKLLYTLCTFSVCFLPGLLILTWGTFLTCLGIFCKYKRLKGYGFRLLISVDQLFNTIFNGSEDETISSRAGKRQKKKLWAKLLCWFLDKIDKNHCKDAIEKDE